MDRYQPRPLFHAAARLALGLLLTCSLGNPAFSQSRAKEQRDREASYSRGEMAAHRLALATAPYASTKKLTDGYSLLDQCADANYLLSRFDKSVEVLGAELERNMLDTFHGQKAAKTLAEIAAEKKKGDAASQPVLTRLQRELESSLTGYLRLQPGLTLADTQLAEDFVHRVVEDFWRKRCESLNDEAAFAAALKQAASEWDIKHDDEFIQGWIYATTISLPSQLTSLEQLRRLVSARFTGDEEFLTLQHLKRRCVALIAHAKKEGDDTEFPTTIPKECKPWQD